MSVLIRSIAEQLQQEHRLLEAAADELRKLVERPVRAPATQAAWLNSVREGLLSLGSHLKTHFAFEEFGGFMEQVLSDSPNSSTQVEKLKQDHQTLLAESEKLCRLARNKSLPSDTLQLRKKVGQFLDLLNQHEHAENELVQRVFVSDIGLAD